MSRFIPRKARKSPWFGLCAVLFGCVALGSSPAEAGGAQIHVPVSTVRSSDGMIFVALYERSSWLKPGRYARAQKVRAHRGTVTAWFGGLPPGRYGVAVFHDENGNGRVDTNPVGMPKEGFGFSRKTPLRKPSFDEVAVEVGSRANAPIHLRY